MLSLTKKVKCPQCNEEIVISGDTLAKAVERAKKIGLFSLAFRHKDHVVLIYIDEKGGIIFFGDTKEYLKYKKKILDKN